MSDFVSIIFYIFSFLFSVFLYKLYEKSNKKIFEVLSFIIPMVIGGFRNFVGTDYPLYITLYNNNSTVDFGFIVISRIAKYFNSYQLMFFIYNFLTLLFIFLGLKNVDKKFRTFSYFGYLFLFYTSSFNIIRQMLAVSIIFYSFKYIINKNFFKFFIWVIVATCFHNTAILVLPLYIIVNFNIKYKLFSLAVLLLICLNYEKLIYIFSNISILSKFVRYSEYTGTVSFNNYSFYLDLLILIYLLIFRKAINNYNKDNDKYLYMYSISVILMLTGFTNPAVKRIANYFKTSILFLLPVIPYVQKDSKNKMLHFLIIIIYVIGSLVMFAYVLKQADIIPYNFMNL